MSEHLGTNTILGPRARDSNRLQVPRRRARYQGDSELQPRQDGSRGAELHCGMERGDVADGGREGGDAERDAEEEGEVCETVSSDRQEGWLDIGSRKGIRGIRKTTDMTSDSLRQ